MNEVSIASSSDHCLEPEGQRPTLVVFADDWGRHPSSCQHLVKRLSHKFQVLWVNTIGTRSPNLDLYTLRRGFEKIRSWGTRQKTVGADLDVIDVPMLPWSNSRVSRAINRRLITGKLRKQLQQMNVENFVVLTTLPHISQFLGNLGQSRLVYYCTDDYSQWPNAHQAAMLNAERITLKQSDLVLAVSQHLAERCRSAKWCELFPHAVDFDHFAKSATIQPDDELLKIPGPRIGFFGLIYEKLDFQLLSRIATKYPNASLVLIGPIDYCPARFQDLPNVHLVGPRPYESLPEWIAGLDVLLLPYVMDEMIRQSSPLKLRECLATGKPTISVEVPEARSYVPHVRVAKTHDEFLSAINDSLLEESDSPKRRHRQDQVEVETWDTRANQLVEYLQSLHVMPSTPS